MADLTIDMDDRSLDDAADRLDEASGELADDETLMVTLHNLNPREAIGFFEGALDAGYDVVVREIATDVSNHGSVIEMIRDEAEIVDIQRLTTELRL